LLAKAHGRSGAVEDSIGAVEETTGAVEDSTAAMVEPGI
jgi:hypothetical protein